MSLRTQLGDASSPVRRWMDTHLDRRAASNFVRSLNDILIRHPALVITGTNPPLAGTAFDYAFRWLLGPLDDIVAQHGARMLQHKHGWKVAEKVVEHILQMGNAHTDPQTRARCCIVLSWFEWMMRSGLVPEALEACIGAPAAVAMNQLFELAPQATVDDVAQLLATVPEVWGADLRRSFILNPNFSGSGLVGGADADWIVEGTLYDCKCSYEARPFGRLELLQGLSYVLLDAYNDEHIHSLAWYYARQQARPAYALVELLPQLFGTADLIALRASFWETVSPRVKPIDRATRAIKQQARAAMENLLTVALGQQADKWTIECQLTSGIDGLVAPEGTRAIPSGWCGMVTVRCARAATILLVIPGPQGEGILWAPVDGTRLDDARRMPVRILPDVLTAASAMGKSFIRWLRSRGSPE